MPYLALGVVALALVFLTTRGRPLFRVRNWRPVAGALAAAAFGAAGWLSVEGRWGAGVVLLIVALWMATEARRRGPAPPPAPTERMSAAEARRILGVEETATPEEVQAAYARLMRAVHPDKGGTAGLAAQLNAARDRLLKR
jgi:hypothetical protein